VPRKKPEKKRPDIVSMNVSPEAKRQLDRVSEHRGMSIKRLLGQLITWFVDLDRTEQSVVLGQVEAHHWGLVIQVQALDPFGVVAADGRRLILRDRCGGRKRIPSAPARSKSVAGILSGGAALPRITPATLALGAASRRSFPVDALRRRRSGCPVQLNAGKNRDAVHAG
jgi:hypothetical protein